MTPPTLTPEQEEEQAYLLASRDAEGCYYLARDVPGADVPALQEVVAASGNAPWCYAFARDVTGANAPALQDVVATSGDAYWCYAFARSVEGSDILSLARVVALGESAADDLQDLALKHPAILTPEVLANLSLGVTL